MTAGARRWSGRLLLVADVAVANVLAGLYVFGFFSPARVQLQEGALEDGGRALVLPLEPAVGWLLLLAALLLLIWNLSVLFRRRGAAVPQAFLDSEADGGPVRVAREAVEAALRQAGESLADVTRLRVYVRRTAARRVVVTGLYHCAEGRDHLQASERLRRTLLERFTQLVRLPDGGRCELQLEFQGFLGKPGRDATEAEPEPAPEEDEPFRGPRYPIEEDPSLE